MSHLDHDGVLAEATLHVVTAYLTGHRIAPGELPRLVANVCLGLAALGAERKPEPPPARPKPAVSVRQSIAHDHLVCLENGQRFKSLKRHLMTSYGMTPDQYRAKWGLAPDYPMVAPGYAEARAALAKAMGFGRRRAHLPA